MKQAPDKSLSKTGVLFFVVGLLVAAAGASGWFYYSSRLQEVPPPPAKAPPGIRPLARIVVAPQVSGTPAAGTQSEPTPPTSEGPDRIRFEPGADPLEKFRTDMNEAVVQEVSPAFPQVKTVLNEQPGEDKLHSGQQLFFQLLDAAEKAPVKLRPAILFAADLVGERDLGCDTSGRRDRGDTACPELRSELARYQIGLKYDELGAGVYYAHDLLWRIWRDYPSSDIGERVFVLLLDRGWDTSNTCAKGADQTMEVIHQGEAFLQQRPDSPYRGAVTLLVAEAYASRWSLSAKPHDGMADYVDPKQFQEGAEDARLKGIGYFEQVLQLAPETELGEYARNILPHLREAHVLDNYRFYCVYD